MTVDHRHVRVLVRADAGPRIGTGHVVRCLSLAAELAERGASVVFATHCPDSLMGRIAADGHGVAALGDLARLHADKPSRVWTDDEQHADALATVAAVGDEFDVVVVDHYGLSAPWEAHFGSQSRMLAIDDLANRPHDVDVITDQNWYGPGSGARYHELVRPDTVQLLGPRYAILQRPYRRVARVEPVRVPPRRLVVSFGGTDPGGETAKVLEAIEAEPFESLVVDVIVGAASQVNDTLQALVDRREQTHLHVAIPSLAPLLARADLAIGASGAATWERLATGVPAIVTTVAPHQSGVTSALHNEGVTRWLGLIEDTDPATYRTALLEVLVAPAGWAPRVVDGFGAGRLAEALVPSSRADLTIRTLEPADAGAVLGLGAEDVGQAESVDGLLGGPTAWRREEHAFDELLADVASAAVIEARGVPVAAVVDGGETTWIQGCVIDESVRRAIRAMPLPGQSASITE